MPPRVSFSASPRTPSGPFPAQAASSGATSRAPIHRHSLSPDSEGSAGLDNIKFTQNFVGSSVPGKTQKSGRKPRVLSSSDSSEEIQPQTPKRRKERRPSGRSARAPIVIDGDDEESGADETGSGSHGPRTSTRTTSVPTSRKRRTGQRKERSVTPEAASEPIDQSYLPRTRNGRSLSSSPLFITATEEEPGTSPIASDAESSHSRVPTARRRSPVSARPTPHLELEVWSASRRSEYATPVSPTALRRITARAQQATARSAPVDAKTGPKSKWELGANIVDDDEEDSDEPLVLGHLRPQNGYTASASNRKGKGRAVSPDDDEDERPRSSKATTGRRDPPPKVSKTNVKDIKRKTARNSPIKKSRLAVDPDEDNGDAVTEEEDNVLENLKMDKMSRFKTKTRLRKKGESVYQRNIRKLHERREGIAPVDTTEDEDESDDVDEEEEEDKSSIDSVDFIESDDEEIPRELPQGFSIDTHQSTEFKFKVVFQYMVLLVMRGPGCLPLGREDHKYFRPPLESIRRQTKGYREGRVRSQIWRANLTEALNKYPTFIADKLDDPEPGCDACNNSTKAAHHLVRLVDWPYDPETHEPLPSSAESGEEFKRTVRSKKKPKKEVRNEPAWEFKKNIKKRDRTTQRHSSTATGGSDSDQSEEGADRTFRMGEMCLRKTRCYHQMYHWEDALYRSVQHNYHDLLRALGKPVEHDSESPDDENGMNGAALVRRQNRINRLQRHGVVLPKQYKDVNVVTKWMVDMGYETAAFRTWNNLIRMSEALEKDRKTDANI